jgi:phytoene dehydrogenase-like protein
MAIKTHYDAVVVGGGHNGLVSASYLAHAGLRVLLLESGHELGGATVSQKVFPGMDARLSRYSYLVSLLSPTIIKELGLRFSTRRRKIASCTPYTRDGVAGALLLSNVDADASYTSFHALTGDADWRGYHRLLELEQALASMVWPTVLEPLRSREDWKALLGTPTERDAWEAFVERPVGETIEQLIQHDVLRGMVFTDGKIGIFTHAHDETLIQNRCFIMHVIGNGTGEWLVPVGGMGTLVDELASSARRGGAQLVTGASVEAISTGNPHHSIVFNHNGQRMEVSATRVLVSAGPQVFSRLLGTTLANSPTDEGSVCKVNMLLRRLPRLKAAGIDPRDAFAGTLHIDESYSQMEASFRQAASGSLPHVPPAEVYCHTLTDDSILGDDLRKQDYQTLTLFGLDVPYRLFETEKEEKKSAMLQGYLRGLNRLLDEPIEDCIALDSEGKQCIEIKCPQDLENDVALDRGNIFHSTLSWFFADEPAQVGTYGVDTGFDRVYRCGSSALRGGAVSGIPGRNAAHQIFNELGIDMPAAR